MIIVSKIILFLIREISTSDKISLIINITEEFLAVKQFISPLLLSNKLDGI